MLITEYFHKIESRIAECIHVVESSVTKDQRSLHIGIIEGRLLFTDESSLHFIEFVDVKGGVEKFKYAYHYQDRRGNMIIRYDMAPHHPEIPTFPHHKHTHSNGVVKCGPPTLARVLDEIEEIIGQIK
ncbi:MAG: DUF6516 family protein [Desulfatiglandaceae bacterium]